MIEKSGLIHYSSYRGKVSHVILPDSETPTYWGDSKQKCVFGTFPENVFSGSVAAFIIFFLNNYHEKVCTRVLSVDQTFSVAMVM